MLQQWLLLTMLGANPQTLPCADVVHAPDADVAHVPDAGPDAVDPWLDPATADLVIAPKPRIERRVGDKGVKVDIDIPEDLVDRPRKDCR